MRAANTACGASEKTTSRAQAVHLLEPSLFRPSVLEPNLKRESFTWELTGNYSSNKSN